MKKRKGQSENGNVFTQLILALASNPSVYTGTAQDAAKLPRLADQILIEAFQEQLTDTEENLK